ncbi:MAG: PIN domain-containing protein [Syntrophaceae bacterium]|nr:PIN domain-containing protein [Syntrophaceae bacterium]
MRVFIDTSAFYALLDRDDDNHARARNAWTDILEAGAVAVTSSYVLVETVALMQSRVGMEAVRAFEEAIVPVLHVEYVTGVSIHAPLRRGATPAVRSCAPGRFQSTPPPERGATGLRKVGGPGQVSIHAPLQRGATRPPKPCSGMVSIHAPLQREERPGMSRRRS